MPGCSFESTSGLSGCYYFEVESPALPVLMALMVDGGRLKSVGITHAPYGASSAIVQYNTLAAHHQSKAQAEPEQMGWAVDTAFPVGVWRSHLAEGVDV